MRHPAQVILGFVAVCLFTPARGIAQVPLVREGTTVKVADGVYVCPQKSLRCAVIVRSPDAPAVKTAGSWETFP